MSTEHALFTAALGLSAPWEVSDIRFDAETKRIDFDVTFASGSRFACPACGAEGQPVHDTRERTWQHLHFFEHQAFIHAAVPRVRCQDCGKTTQVDVPWARPGSGFSQLFEAMAITLCREMPVRKVAALLGVGDDALWRLLDHYVGAARAQEDFGGVRALGIDETAARRGQDYITIFQNLEEQRLLFACPGRSQATVARFAEDLRQHGGEPERVEAACIDMSKAYIAGVQRHLPQAAITFDAFHLVKLANEAVDEVRRAEVRSESALKGTRWLWLKDAYRFSMRQITELHHLSRQRLKTGRAWRIKETLRDILTKSGDRAEAEQALKKWYSWARRCRLEPFKRFALTVKAHWEGILNRFDSRLSNGAVEGMNAQIQAAKARARGFRRVENLITVSYLVCGKLSHLPASPYRTTSRAAAA